MKERKYFYIYNIILLGVTIGIFVYPFLMPYLSRYEIFEASHKVEEVLNIKSPTDGVATDIRNFVASFPFFYQVSWNNPITPLFIIILTANIFYRMWTITYYIIKDDLDAESYKEKISKDVIVCTVVVLSYYVINLICWFIRYFLL